MRKWCLIFVCLACLVSWMTFHQTQHDDADLQALQDTADCSQREQSGGLVSYCQQFREGITKDLVFRDGPPRCCHLTSRQSELFLFKQEKSLEIVEELDDVYCVLQEELYKTADGTPMQILHTLQAQRACYDYTSQTLTAADAYVCKYRVPSHDFAIGLQHLKQHKAMMTAKARHVTLHVRAHDYDVAAKGLTLTMEPL